MKHSASRRFWTCYDSLPEPIRHTADRCFTLLKNDPSHPSLRFKKVGNFWSARIGVSYRALAVSDGDDLIWVWIGTHDEYERLIAGHMPPATKKY